MEQLEEEINESNLQPSKKAIKLANVLRERYAQEEKDKLIKGFIDKLQERIYKEIVGGEASVLLKERYKVKEKVAYKALYGTEKEKEKAKKLLQEEARIVGTSVDNYANIILKTAKLYKYDEQELIMRLEAIRIAIKKHTYKKLAEEIKKIEKMLLSKQIEEILYNIEKRLLNGE